MFLPEMSSMIIIRVNGAQNFTYYYLQLGQGFKREI